MLKNNFESCWVDFQSKKINKLNKVLRDKDRIEIYRPLIADPKESRRQQAEMQKKNAEQNNKS